MLATEYFHLPSTRTHSLNQTISFIRFPTRLSNLRHNYIRVQTLIRPRREFQSTVRIRVRLHAHEHVFFGMVQPMSGTPCSDDTLELVGFHPDYFVDASVAPVAHAFSADFHCSPGHPEEEETFVLEFWNRHRAHFVVGHCTVR